MSQEPLPPHQGTESERQSPPSRSTRTVFSRLEKVDKRSSTIRKFDKRSYWLVEKDDKMNLTIQKLNKDNLPTGEKQAISLKDLLRDYKAEPDFFSRSVYPKLCKLEESINKADAYRGECDHRSAAYEYGNALDVDIENIRANFGAALSYLEQGERAKAANIFNRLVRLNGTFLPCHKHLFNEFGISMRKNKMYEQSISYYARALELTQEDENLHFNIARPLFEQGFLLECVEHLMQANMLNPGNAHSICFLAWLKNKDCVPGKYRSVVDAMLALFDVPDLSCLPDEEAGALPENVPEECLEALRRIEEESREENTLADEQQAGSASPASGPETRLATECNGQSKTARPDR